MDRLVGRITDKFGTRVDAIQIDIRRRGELLASFAAEPQPERECFIFSFDIEGRFTAAELVKEEIMLTARDNEGNTGRVWLDGAAQLELIRDHLGFPAVTVLNLDFSRGGNAGPYLGKGWSAAEPDFTWTEDEDSFITFDTPNEPGTYALRLTAGVILNRPELSSQSLVAFINGTQVAQISCREVFAQFHESKFPYEVFGDSIKSTLRLHHPDAIRPKEVGPHPDQRRLAFNVKRLSIARLLPVPVS